MRFDYDNCSIILDDGKGKVYRNDRLMFKGDGYVAIKFLLNFTNNAEAVKNKFNAQLSQREKCRWQKNDDKEQLEKKMRAEAEKAKEELKSKPRTRRRN
tara:strand:+ start:1195 stop:1491 length:297 start_codon:yes stop_codon:yes gene_type:complete